MFYNFYISFWPNLTSAPKNRHLLNACGPKFTLKLINPRARRHCPRDCVICHVAQMLLRNLLMLLRAFHWQILLASIMSLDYVDRQFNSLGVPKPALGDSHQYVFDRHTASSTRWEQCRAVTTAVKNHHPREDVYCWMRASPLERHNERQLATLVGGLLTLRFPARGRLSKTFLPQI